jgi:hypothetical protein
MWAPASVDDFQETVFIDGALELDRQVGDVVGHAFAPDSLAP